MRLRPSADKIGIEHTSFLFVDASKVLSRNILIEYVSFSCLDASKCEKEGIGLERVSVLVSGASVSNCEKELIGLEHLSQVHPCVKKKRSDSSMSQSLSKIQEIDMLDSKALSARGMVFANSRFGLVSLSQSDASRFGKI